MSTAAKVGAFFLVVLIIAGLLIWKIEDLKIGRIVGKTVSIQFDDVAGDKLRRLDDSRAAIAHDRRARYREMDERIHGAAGPKIDRETDRRVHHEYGADGGGFLRVRQLAQRFERAGLRGRQRGHVGLAARAERRRARCDRRLAAGAVHAQLKPG